MIEIRKVEQKDYTQIIELIADFAEEALAEYGTYLEEKKLMSSFQSMYSTSFVAVKGDEVIGVLGGRVVTDFCSDLPAYEEVIWYMKTEYRKYGIRLFHHVIEWCIVHGLGRITMCCMHNSKTEKLFKLYKQMGFRPMETRFIKELD